VTNGHVGGRLREELPKTRISGNRESELTHVHYLDTLNRDMITVVDRGDNTIPYIWHWTETEDWEFGKHESRLTLL
jgi:hypothetical protein